MTPLLGRSGPPPSLWPTTAGSSSIHHATLAGGRAEPTTEPVQPIQPRLNGLTGLVLRRPERNVGCRRASALRVAGAGDVLDVSKSSRSTERTGQKASGTPAVKGLTYLRWASVTDKTLLL